MWEISREHAILLGGPAAAILQICHPHVAAGVEQHSAFRRNSLRRLTRTLEAVYAISFGTVEAAEATRREIGRVHARVRGTVEVSGRLETYSAFDPEPQKWVLATLTATAIRMYETFVRPLAEPEKTGYVLDMNRWGSFFGLDPARNPQNWGEFSRYWQTMLDDPRLGSHPASPALARAILRPAPFWIGGLLAPFSFITREVLPARLRGVLRLDSTPGSRFAWAMFRALVRGGLPALPDRFRYAGAYLRAREAYRPADSGNPPMPCG